MFSAFRNAFKIPDLRNKILFTIFVVALYRLGSHIPVPGIDFNAVDAASKEQQSSGIYGLINLFSGGALTKFAIFALGIMPYITSSIIMQLLTVVIPRLEAYQREGEAGQKKITQYTRYMTVALALLQSLGIVVTADQILGGGGPGQPIRKLFGEPPSGGLTPGKTLIVVLTLTAGTALIMWLGETITQRGIGNGMSILIFSSIISRLPAETSAIYATAGKVKSAVLLGLGILIIVAVVLVEQAQRRIPVQYAKRVVGRKLYGGSSTYIPMKVNQAGVIPIIFASSLLYLPVLAATIVTNSGFKRFVDQYFATGSHPVYVMSYFLMIIFFTYFYTAIAFNPTDVADNMKKYGGFIPGIRPGRPTAEYLEHILTRITLPGSFFLASIAILPFIVQGAWKIQAFPFGGTAILIVVGVSLETMKQIESQLLMRHYEGFLK